MYQILIIDVINLEEQFMARIFRNCLMLYYFVSITLKQLLH